VSIRRDQFRHLDRLRVRWAEVDMQKIVFNAHYLMYFDTAVAGYWRAMALPYEATMNDLGGDLFVRKATVEYEASARYEDELDVGICVQRFGNTSMTLQAAIFRGEQRLVSGELVYVYADPSTQRPLPVPQALRDVLQAFDDGQAAVTVETGGWETLGEQAQTIRQAVFVQEQGIPADLEWDAADQTAVHALARNRLGRAVGTGRLLAHAPGVAKIGRMAVLPGLRGAGVGRSLLDALARAARERGERALLLHAQRSAVGFYRRLGFVPDGEPFEEAGIPHQAMRRALAA